MVAPLNIDKLKQGLMSDLSQAQESSKKSAESRGAPEDPDFAPKALRIKNKLVGESELQASTDAIEKMIKNLSSEAGFVDSMEAGRFEQGLRKKMNQFRLILMRQAGEAQRQMAQKRMDQQMSQAIWSGLSNLTSGLSSAIVSGAGSAGGGSTLGSNVKIQEPELGSQFQTPPPNLGVDTSLGTKFTGRSNFNNGE